MLMLDLAQLTLDSDRVRLEPLALHHRDAVFQEFTGAIARYMYPKPCSSLAEAEQGISRALQQRQRQTDLHLVIADRTSREFLGMVGLHRIDTETPEFGIWLKQSAQGFGFGREAIHRFKHWVDDALDYRFIAYSVDQDNLPSRKIPESLGGHIVREFQLMSQSGNLLHLLEYRIYPSRRRS
jgi:RimJ/RimL family protein N-acetyltransferase